MKSSITRKIILSYFLLIFLSFMVLSLLFNVAARTTMENQAKDSMLQDMDIIKTELEKVIGNSRAVDYRNLRERIKDVLQQNIYSRPRFIRLSSLESDWILVSTDLKLIFRDFSTKGSKNSEFLTQLLEEVKKFDNTNKINKITIDGTDYFVTLGQLEGVRAKNNMNASVLLYITIGPVKQFASSMFRGLILAIGVTGLIAVVFGVIFARSIAKPIIRLKQRAKLLSKRDFDTRVVINTGDELEDLANTLDDMASELKEYDISQKRFLQNASHELKTPLMSIQGYAEGIRDGVFDDNDEALNIITDESIRMKKLVEEIIFLSKLETMEDFYVFVPERLNSTLGKSVEKIRSLALKNNIDISINAASNPLVEMDRDKLIQAFINVLGNCIRYASSAIGIETYPEGKNAVIRIYDDGNGFSEKEVQKVFERFYKGKKGNTGLGLAITKVIIEKHGGSISVNNREERGAEFVICLPVPND